MTPINKVLSQLSNELKSYETSPQQNTANAKVQDIYNQCKKIEKERSAEIKGNRTLEKKFEELESKVHHLFFKC